MKGKSAHDGPISGSVSTTITRKHIRAYVDNRGAKLEGKYSDKATGMSIPVRAACDHEQPSDHAAPELHRPQHHRSRQLLVAAQLLDWHLYSSACQAASTCANIDSPPRS